MLVLNALFTMALVLGFGRGDPSYDNITQLYPGLQIFDQVVFDMCGAQFDKCEPLLRAESRAGNINLNKWTPLCDQVQCDCYNTTYCWPPAQCSPLARCSSLRFKCLQAHVEPLLHGIGEVCDSFLSCALSATVRHAQNASCVSQFMNMNPGCDAADGLSACDFVFDDFTFSPPTNTQVPTPPPPISPAEYEKLRTEIEEFRVFDSAISRADQCGTALSPCAQELFAANLSDEAAQHRKHCDRVFCDCAQVTPAAGLERCAPPRTDCDAMTRCFSNRKKCFGHWLFRRLGGFDGCTSFIQCARRPDVVSKQLARCRSVVSCDSAARCEYAEDPNGAFDNVPITNPPAGNSGPKIALKIIIGIVVAAGVVIIITLMVVTYSKLGSRHRNIVLRRGASTLQHVQVRVADPVRWFGLKHDVQDDATAKKLNKCSVPGCQRSLGLEGRKVLLPCRCEWCGCDVNTGIPSASRVWSDAHLPDFNVDARVRAYPGSQIVCSDVLGKKIRTYACRQCKTPIDSVLDLRNMYIEDISSARSDRSSDSGIPKCCVCLAAPVAVVWLPCSHLATCRDCASRLCKGVPRRGAEPGTVEVSSTCPKCRAVCEAMVVLDSNQITDAVAVAQYQKGAAP